jgi:hypothetical protein
VALVRSGSPPAQPENTSSRRLRQRSQEGSGWSADGSLGDNLTSQTRQKIKPAVLTQYERFLTHRQERPPVPSGAHCWASSAMTKATHTAARGTRPRRQAPASYTAVALANLPTVREPDRRSFPHGAPRYRIYRPASSPLQWCGSGRRRWVLAFEPVSAPAIAADRLDRVRRSVRADSSDVSKPHRGNRVRRALRARLPRC